MNMRFLCYFTIVAAVVCAPSARTGSAADDPELKRLYGLASTAQKAPPAEQVTRWKEFLKESSAFAEKNSTLDMWLLRATAALAANDEEAGTAAAAKLVALQALTSNDELLRKVMASLVVKGWIPDVGKTGDKVAEKTSTPAPSKDQTYNYLNDVFGRYQLKEEKRKEKYGKEIYRIELYGRDTLILSLETTVLRSSRDDSTVKDYTVPFSRVDKIEFDGSEVTIRTFGNDVVCETSKFGHSDWYNVGKEKMDSVRLPLASSEDARKATNALKHYRSFFVTERPVDPFDK